MEGSRTNVYFYRGGRWVTPSEETGCLKGTERRWLLERAMVEVEDIMVGDVKDGDVVLLSNGLRGMWAGTVRRAT
jgi:4-amino-4-deoxychorismate lyase